MANSPSNKLHYQISSINCSKNVKNFETFINCWLDTEKKPLLQTVYHSIQPVTVTRWVTLVIFQSILCPEKSSMKFIIITFPPHQEIPNQRTHLSIFSFVEHQCSLMCVYKVIFFSTAYITNFCTFFWFLYFVTVQQACPANGANVFLCLRMRANQQRMDLYQENKIISVTINGIFVHTIKRFSYTHYYTLRHMGKFC